MNPDRQSPGKGDILLVDDTPDNLRLLSKLLCDQGYYSRPVNSGQKAISAILEQLPDLILLDIMMPGMNGYEVCERLKADEHTRDIPVIFLSALDELQNKMQAFQLGGVDYITKPFQEEEVLARVRTHLELRMLRQRLREENARFRALADATFEGIVIHDKGKILDLNHEAVRIFGDSYASLVGRLLPDLAPAPFRDTILSVDCSPCEMEIAGPDGIFIPVEVQGKALQRRDGELGVTAIRDMSRQKTLEQENAALRGDLRDRYKFGNLIGYSPAMQRIYELIAKAAASEYAVLVCGESGTGKELVAQTIHSLSARNGNAFVPVNCGAITESLFEREFFGHEKGAFTGADRSRPGFFDAANRGTLFLDELGTLSPAMQVKLLRVLESGEFIPVGASIPRQTDARIIAATNQDLTALVKRGDFREDLFFRIHVIEITLPPLRERLEDLPLLTEHFFAQQGAARNYNKFPAKFLEMLSHHEWPGNVRELKNTVQRYIATNELHLPTLRSEAGDEEDARTTHAGLQEKLNALEKDLITDALRQNNWNRGKAAKKLGISRRNLQRKTAKYGLRSVD